MKYIVLNSMELYMFMPHIDHKEHARRVATPECRVTGAGFISKDWQCYGESVGLGIGKGAMDDRLLEIALRNAK